MEKNKQFGCQHTSSPTIWEDGRLVGGLEEWEKLVSCTTVPIFLFNALRLLSVTVIASRGLSRNSHTSPLRRTNSCSKTASTPK